MISRNYNIGKLLEKQKVLVIYGARRVGKTTMLNDFLVKCRMSYKLDSGDNIRIQEVLSSQDFNQISSYAEGYNLIALDEAQNIPNIGVALKIMIDNIPNIRIIATGSSSFRISQDIGEPLTGRKKTILLYPLSQRELLTQYNKFELMENLEQFLIYGSYPEIILAKSTKQKIERLNELVDSYLLKDIFVLDNIKGSRQLFDLLKLIAFQVGNLVAMNELAQQVRLDVKTVGKYLDLLEKSFVIKKVGGYSKNLRNEITTKSKYYFIDNGIRNAVISQFNLLKDRNDKGQLFENFIVSELLKSNSFNNYNNPLYFWRTYEGYAIDIIEERAGRIMSKEIKWNDSSKVKKPKLWVKSYKNAKYLVIHSKNYLEYIL